MESLKNSINLCIELTVTLCNIFKKTYRLHRLIIKLNFYLLSASFACTSALAENISDRINLAYSAIDLGSEKIAIYSLSDPSLPIPVRVEGGRLSLAQGYDPGKTPSLVASGFRWIPVVSYDSDINGGSSKGSFSLSGFEFIIPEDQRQKSGIILGAEFNSYARSSLGYQTIIDISSTAYFAWSPKHSIGKYNVGISACGTRQLERNYYLSGCVASTYSENYLSRGSVNSSRIGFINIFDSIGYTHEFDLFFSKSKVSDLKDRNSYGQARVEATNTSLSSSGGYFGYGAIIGEKIENEKVMTKSFSIFSRIDDYKIFYGGRYSVFEGGKWFGLPIEEEEYSVYLQVPLRRNSLTIIEYARTLSGSPLNSGSRLSASVQVNL